MLTPIVIGLAAGTLVSAISWMNKWFRKRQRQERALWERGFALYDQWEAARQRLKEER